MGSDLTKVPNLISIGRLFLLIPAAWFISRNDGWSTFYALLILIVAAVSDFLDGFLARRLNQQSELGKLLDPLSDKIMATALVVLLLLYREFPIWLAIVIVARDLLILSGGLKIKRILGFTPPSNLSGKYCFASIAVLLLSYLIRYNFGIFLMLPLTLTLTVVSLIMYVRIYLRVSKTGQLIQFQDKRVYKIVRILATWVISIIFLFKLIMLYI